MVLTNNQKGVLEKAFEVHNLLVLDQSGTSKSFFIKEIEKELVKRNKTMKVTASAQQGLHH